MAELATQPHIHIPRIVVKPISPSLRVVAALAGLALVATSTQAAVYTWTGAAADGDWTNTANWDANGVPVDTDAGVSGLDQQNPSDNIIISGTAPTLNVPLFSGGAAFGGGTSNTPEVEVRLGTLTVSVNTWGGQGLVHRGGNWNSSVGDGDTGNGLAVLNYNVVQSAGNGLNRDDNNVMTWTVNADGTLNIDTLGTTLKMAYSSTRTVGFNLPGGTVNFTKALDLGGHAGNFFDLTAVGAAVTAAFGGSFTDLSAVNTAIGSNIHFISSNAQPLAAVDNGDGSFTVTVGGSGGDTFQLIITPNGANYDFSWDSQDGKLYDLVSSTDLATPILDWPVYAGNADIAGTAPTNMLSGVAPADPARFFAVVKKDPPPPPLVNGSFEDPLTADGAYTIVAPPGWTEFGAGNLGDVGVWNPLVGEHATVPDGENVGYVYHTGSVPMAAFGLSQVLGANFAVDTDYGVTVEVGRAAGYAWPGYRVELWAGASKIAEETNTLVPAADSWATSTLTYTYSGGDAGLAGKALEIRLLSLGEDPEAAGNSAQFEVEFDNVTFTATPTVP